MGSVRLEMKGISIAFPGVKALSDVCFTAETGTVHALVGANGAGKSTLMKILSGVYDHYEGSIEIDGKPVNIRSPRAAKAAGIGTVYQEVDTALIPYLTVAENIMLDVLVNEMRGKTAVRWRRMYAESRRILDTLKLRLDPRKRVEQLTLAQKQMVLIAQALARDCRVLILDEPTAPLSRTETKELFSVIRDLTARDIGVVFISHRLPEVKEICGRVTILRDGRLVADRDMADVSISGIVELMLGRKFEETYPKYPARMGETIFSVSGLSDGSKIHDVNLSVRAGEIVGIAGLVGAGKSELCKALFGAEKRAHGTTAIRGTPRRIRSAHEAVRRGLALVPEERRKEGILVDETVVTNLSAASLGSFCGPLGFIDFRAERKSARDMIGALGIRTPRAEQKVALLSGGNQQKVAVGKWLVADAEVYIFDEPTKGVDVGAKRDIFELIGKLAGQGKGIVYASCELAEIMGICDRIYVMYDGRIVRELLAHETTEQELLFYSTGGR
jgi:simple sugar transport system ATP-binding protein